MTQYLPDLKLYGTNFDLASLDDFTGLRTETVTINADTVFISRPLTRPISFKLSIRARVVSITENIAMEMTREKFFSPLTADQPVDNWAFVDEVITGIGNTSARVRKLGYIEVQSAFNEEKTFIEMPEWNFLCL